MEQDANEIWISTLSVLNSVLLSPKIDVQDIKGIGITNQRETTILWDKKTGRPLYHAIVWQSRQTESICENWKAQGLEAIVKEKTGLLIDPYFSASKIRFLLNHVPGQVESCQLVMGMTQLKPGSVWNTMPCHTHDRRMEVYLYFEVPENNFVMHYMGEPTETRHIVTRNEEIVISPSWSIHSGVGSKAYTFIWGMVGENQDFDDMDAVKMSDLR